MSLKFLGFQSIKIPVGIMLAFCAALGIIAVAVLQPLWGISGSSRASNSSVEDDAEFFVDEDF